ncbi:hypothetical protein Y032_0097g3043 [Ancylostoma ceylanicum]|uniref:Uncharacterized protein n=1 Tax=Ancylostoma ceylanicum TaxID=53326 RepID=A0A016TJT8_9BILA|nr:hypothetical protein Y032_0097g3043 [Ancylostoma ceylanicum]
MFFFYLESHVPDRITKVYGGPAWNYPKQLAGTARIFCKFLVVACCDEFIISSPEERVDRFLSHKGFLLI